MEGRRRIAVPETLEQLTHNAAVEAAWFWAQLDLVRGDEVAEPMMTGLVTAHWLINTAFLIRLLSLLPQGAMAEQQRR
jgi:hypothetical protein